MEANQPASPAFPELTDDQKKMLALIERAGAASPSKLAAETKTLPQEMWAMLEQFAARGLIVMREDPDSPDGVLVFIAMTNMQQQTQPPPNQNR